ncbi:hypothetical protein, partial [Burkholderia gladioli]|uniref:hypothetical protein n=3 Tax=Burkholderia gladioli TaxID=28095 RepID=UPI003F790375
RRRAIAHNGAVAEAALIDPIYTSGFHETFLVTIQEDVRTNEVAWFVKLIDRRIGAMCEDDTGRYERQRLTGGLAMRPMVNDAKRVVMRRSSTELDEPPVMVMEWTPNLLYDLG